ncbi:MAG: hypothetical protein FJY97_20790 [candidate division Zixibacteria bacterium]|nr:hypothetical protein [candidate division Zixibacteria bacterium]
MKTGIFLELPSRSIPLTVVVLFLIFGGWFLVGAEQKPLVEKPPLN